MQTISEAERKNLEHKVRLFLGTISVTEIEKAVSAMINLMEPVHLELDAKADRNELRDILLEIKALREDVNKRFEAVDKRFEDMQQYMDRRFAMLQWFMGIGFLIISIVTPVSVGLLLKMLV